MIVVDVNVGGVDGDGDEGVGSLMPSDSHVFGKDKEEDEGLGGGVGVGEGNGVDGVII